MAGLSQNSGGNPGNHRVPVRNAAGDLTGALATRPDPSCARATENPAIRGSNAFGVSLLGRCWLDFGDTFNYRNPQNLTDYYYGTISYDVNPDLVLPAQITHVAQIRNSRQAQSYLGGVPFNEDVRLEAWVPIGKANTLPGGEVGAAVGVQRRDESLDYTPALGIITGDVFIGVRQNPRTDSRFVNAVFAEFLLPVLDNVQISAAIRIENFSTGQEELIQKYGAVYVLSESACQLGRGLYCADHESVLQDQLRRVLYGRVSYSF